MQDTLKIADVEGGTDFFEGFKTDYNYSDTWDTIISYLKPKTSIDVKDTVNKVMLREKEAKKVREWRCWQKELRFENLDKQVVKEIIHNLFIYFNIVYA